MISDERLDEIEQAMELLEQTVEESLDALTREGLPPELRAHLEAIIRAKRAELENAMRSLPRVH